MHLFEIGFSGIFGNIMRTAMLNRVVKIANETEESFRMRQTLYMTMAVSKFSNTFKLPIFEKIENFLTSIIRQSTYSGYSIKDVRNGNIEAIRCCHESLLEAGHAISKSSIDFDKRMWLKMATNELYLIRFKKDQDFRNDSYTNDVDFHFAENKLACLLEEAKLCKGNDDLVLVYASLIYAAHKVELKMYSLNPKVAKSIINEIYNDLAMNRSGRNTRVVDPHKAAATSNSYTVDDDIFSPIYKDAKAKTEQTFNDIKYHANKMASDVKSSIIFKDVAKKVADLTADVKLSKGFKKIESRIIPVLRRLTTGNNADQKNKNVPKQNYN